VNDDFPIPAWNSLSPARLERRLEHIRSEIASEAHSQPTAARPMLFRFRTVRAVIPAAIATAVALSVVPIGGATLASRAIDGISGLWSSASPPPQDTAAAQNLADAVSRWNAESNDPAHATGTPLLGAARDLVRGLGSSGDTITAFPTRNGAVCYEIRAAGSCGQLDKWPWSKVGFTFSILYTRDAGTRVFGVVSDRVAAIDVEIGGIEHPAIVQNNAFYYQLPRGDRDEDIQRVIATWDDGTRHPFHVHDGKSGPG
jgi:hypothetical protein